MSNDGTKTFWQLIKDCEVIIPKLQRDYAQGRENDPSIEQIRKSLIDEIYASVTEGKPLVLNFIYGEKRADKFVPIDGQQRLTTLFLLHWYVFKKSGFSEGLDRLRYFSYETRDTSRRFCENICGTLAIDFSKESVSDQIEEFHWFTRNFVMDPTIKSMLVVIDALHRQFRNVEDIDPVKKTLINDDCPISFLWLEMPNFQQTSDLYIKMNARGKLLSDFEIFKAKLQNSEILKRILEQTGQSVSDDNKVNFISKYNNEYAEFFYKYFDKEYDNALMDFIKEMIRDLYLSYVSISGVPQKAYRSDYDSIRNMNGSVLFRYIENGGTKGKKEYDEKCKDEEAKEAFIDALKRVDTLLEYFKLIGRLDFENTKKYYDEEKLFEDGHNPETTRQKDLVRYSIYSFLYKFGIPSTDEQKNAYIMWKRIIHNIVENSPFEGRSADICEAFVFIERVIGNIQNCGESDVLSAIESVDRNHYTSATKNQVEEEKIKAQLMLQGADWKEEILKAESYFEDGQIGFILDWSKCGDGSYDIDLFRKYLKCLSKIFDDKKQMKAEINASTFEQALLCMKDEDEENMGTGHLLKQSNSTTSWGFVTRNYKDLLKNITLPSKKKILKSLIDVIMTSTKGINETLTDIISNVDEASFTDKSKWKIPFIRNELFNISMGDFLFKNRVNLDRDNSQILMIAGTTIRAKSMELNTFLLYQKLCRRNIPSKLVLYATGVIKDNEGFPARYISISIDGKVSKIGYDYANHEKPYCFKKFDGSTLYLSEEEVIEIIQEWFPSNLI